MDGKECPLRDVDGAIIGHAKLYYVDGKLHGECEMKDGKKFKGIVDAGDMELTDMSVRT